MSVGAEGSRWRSENGGCATVPRNRDVKGTIVGCAGNGWAGRFCLHQASGVERGYRFAIVYQGIITAQLRRSRHRGYVSLYFGITGASRNPSAGNRPGRRASPGGHSTGGPGWLVPARFQFRFRSGLGSNLFPYPLSVADTMGTNTESTNGSNREDESDEETARRWRNARMTTVILNKEDDGEWDATQRGVDVVGHGETAADAAATYCRLVDDAVHD